MSAILNQIIKIINTIFGFIDDLFSYRTIYAITGIFFTRKFPKAKRCHKYAILIAARNEEKVIGNLLDSIEGQDYPKDLISVFVVADNCSDNTANIARDRGAVCYERHDAEHRTKGYALQYLVRCIERDYRTDSFEGYFIFDADNLLSENYITRMNEAFDAGEKIITSYRHTKNFDDNWISASYALHWLRTIRNEHRARSVFHLATRIQGTGFLFVNDIIKDGWNYTSLTEDRAFCADAVAKGYKISYCNAAVFYDEQPVSFKIAMRQRIRWAKGHLQAFTENAGKLFYHIFFTNGIANSSAQVKDKSKLTGAKRVFNNIRMRFMSFDMLTTIYPRSIFSIFKRLTVFTLRTILIFGAATYTATGSAPTFLRYMLKPFGITLAANNAPIAFLLLILFTVGWTLNTYLGSILVAAYIFIIEHKRIMPMKFIKKLWFCITFPIFDLMGRYSLLIALFSKVEWKPIPHEAALKIEDISPSEGKKRASGGDFAKNMRK